MQNFHSSKQKELILPDLCSSSSLMKHRYSLSCHHVIRLVQDSISGQDRPMLLVIITVEITQILLSNKVTNKKTHCETRGARKTEAQRR